MSNRISNLMAADLFFNRHRGKRDINRLEKERFSLTRNKAYRKLYNATYKPQKVSPKGVDFEQWQLDLAVKVLEGENRG